MLARALVTHSWETPSVDLRSNRIRPLDGSPEA